MPNPPEAKQDPNQNPTKESVLDAGNLRDSIIDAVGKTFMGPMEKTGETHKDRIKIATELFDLFLSTHQRQTEQECIDFFVRRVKTRNYKFEDGDLDGLKVRLQAILKYRKIALLYGVRNQCDTLLADYKRGNLKLPKDELEKVREIRIDFNK